MDEGGFVHSLYVWLIANSSSTRRKAKEWEIELGTEEYWRVVVLFGVIIILPRSYKSVLEFGKKTY